MRTFAGRTAVITGAGSGIGRALALELTRRGARTALSDVDTEAVEATAAACRELGGEARAYRLDVRDAGAMDAHATSVRADFGAVHLLVNNAGVGLTADIVDMTVEQLARVMDVDFWGVVHGTRAFLPDLIASGDGHVVNLSSVFGLIAVPSQSAYNAAKFAVRGFTEALAQEMRLAGHPVAVSCVHPGGVRTAIMRNSVTVGYDPAAMNEHFERSLARLSPERAAEIILRGVLRGRTRILVGADAHVIDALARVLGSHYFGLVARNSRAVERTARIDRAPISADDARRPG